MLILRSIFAIPDIWLVASVMHGGNGGVGSSGGDGGGSDAGGGGSGDGGGKGRGTFSET